MRKKQSKKKKKKTTRKSDKSDTIKKRTREKQKLFLQLFEHKAANISMTCESIGISRDTYYEWRKKYPKFDQGCKEIEEGLIDFAESQIIINIKNGKETSLIFFLCNKAKHRGWENLNKIQHFTDPDNPPTIIVKADLSGYSRKEKETESEQ